MNKKQSLVLFATIMLFSQCWAGSLESTRPQSNSVKRLHLPFFNSVKATGDFSIKVVHTKKDSYVELHGDPRAIAQMKAYVGQDTLYLRREIPEIPKEKDNKKAIIEPLGD